MHFNARKFFLIVFFILLLVGIPITIYLVEQQQTIQQQAAKATNFSFAPVSSQSNPIPKQVGDEIALDVMIDPSTNLVSVVKLVINYDSDKLSVAEGDFKPNTAVFETVQEGPVYEDGVITVSMSTGSNPSKIIQSKVKAATITFKAEAKTEAGSPTLVSYDGDDSLAYSGGSSDQGLENVYKGQVPAYIAIGGSEEEAEPTATNTPAPTEEPEPTDEPTTTTGGGSNNSLPSCIALTANQTSGRPPLAVNFTANGKDSDGTIEKVTFNFGDGQVSDVTSGGGIGSASANVQLSHTYSAGGSFQATAILTDDEGGISSTANCLQAISVQGNETPTPTIVPSGSVEALFGVGAASVLLMIGGALIFLLL